MDLKDEMKTNKIESESKYDSIFYNIWSNNNDKHSGTKLIQSNNFSTIYFLNCKKPPYGIKVIIRHSYYRVDLNFDQVIVDVIIFPFSVNYLSNTMKYSLGSKN